MIEPLIAGCLFSCDALGPARMNGKLNFNHDCGVYVEGVTMKGCTVDLFQQRVNLLSKFVIRLAEFWVSVDCRGATAHKQKLIHKLKFTGQ